MKSIKFNDQELEFIRDQYQMELEEAEKYVESLRTIIKKLGSPIPKKIAEPVEKIPKKRDRKPKLIKEEVLVKPIKKKRKPRKDKGSIRVKPVKPVKPEVQSKTPVLKTDEQSKKKLAPKKKTKKRSYKSKGVFLTPLSKPLKKKAIVEPPLPTETTPEKVEKDLTIQDS
jgi:hypothetical protein